MNVTSNEKRCALARQRALVTGADSGIGKAVAKSLAAAGKRPASLYAAV